MKIILKLFHCILNLMVTIMKRLQDGFTRAVFGKEKNVTKTSFYELVDRDMGGKEVPMSTFAGKVLLVTNVASK